MSTMTAAAPVARKPLYTSLFVQVLVALLLGIVLGVAVPDFAIGLKIFSDAFLKLISMIVAPIVFCVVVHGIAGAGDLRKVGRVGVKALIYFEVMTTVALVVGLLLAYLFGPGHGMNIDPSTLDAKALNTYADNAHKLQGGGIGSFLLNIIPTTSFDALARNDVLQVLFFAIIFGTSLALVGGEKGEKITSLIDAVSTVLFRAMGLIVRLAPLGGKPNRLRPTTVEKTLPNPLTLADIQGMTHCHTIYSDGQNSIEEMAWLADSKSLIALIQQGGTKAHPSYWAPFVVVGENR